jgi:hypothetical protein
LVGGFVGRLVGGFAGRMVGLLVGRYDVGTVVVVRFFCWNIVDSPVGRFVDRGLLRENGVVGGGVMMIFEGDKGSVGDGVDVVNVSDKGLSNCVIPNFVFTSCMILNSN